MLTLGKKNVLSESSTEKFEKEQQCKPRNTSREIEIKKKYIENTNRDHHYSLK